MAEETPAGPLGRYQVLRWGEEPTGPTSNAVADPPAASVAVEPEPTPAPDPGESDETPEGDVLPDGSADVPEGDSGEEGEPVEAEAGEQPQRSKRPIQPRISELTQERNAAREAAQAAEMARAKAEGYAQALQEMFDRNRDSQPPRRDEPPVPTVPDDGAPRDAQGRLTLPREHDYATTEAYYGAMQAYEQARDEERYRLFAQRYQQEQRQQQARDAAQSVIAQARERFPNFERLVEQVPYQFGPAAQVAINDSPQWASVIAHLALHPDEARALQQANLWDAMNAVKRIEAQWQTPPETPAVETPPSVNGATGAGAGNPSLRLTTPPAPPPPVNPVRGRSGTPAPRTYDELSFMDFMRIRNEEERASRR